MTGPLDLLVENTSEVLTLEGDGPGELGALVHAVVGVRGEEIVYLGRRAGLPADAVGPQTKRLDAQGGLVGPGFVDAHTHLVFAGERAAEFDLRNQGATYLELAKAGGGIQSTVTAVRAATEDMLLASARHRLRRLLGQGVTTLEVKSGYGLTVADELKMLRVVRRLAAEAPVTLVPTLLCAHAVPTEYAHDRAGYLRLCREEILPAVAREGLAVACDAFVESGAFSHDEARLLLTSAAREGLWARLHVDQLTPGKGAQLAAELGARSADHLEQIDDEGIEALSQAGVVATLVPVSTLFLRARPYAPGRRLIDAGVTVALGTNLNPGSAMCENVGVTLSLACLENGLTAAEAYRAFTRGAARALNLPRHGRLTVGGPADLVAFGCNTVRHLAYHLGTNHVRWVVQGGRVVHQGDPLASAGCDE